MHLAGSPCIRNELPTPKVDDSANRAGSGHGGSSESSDVRLPPSVRRKRRTKNAPKKAALMMHRQGGFF